MVASVDHASCATTDHSGLPVQEGVALRVRGCAQVQREDAAPGHHVDRAVRHVEDASGKGYPVRTGAKIGDKGGVIIEILPDAVKVLETTTDMTGTTTQQVSELKIQARGAADDNKKKKKRKF